MAFVGEAEPAHGAMLNVIEGVSRVVAFNPSVMTYHGTNTFLIDDGEGGLTVLDVKSHRTVTPLLISPSALILFVNLRI